MFWNKKEPIIKKRILALYNKLEKIQNTIKDKNLCYYNKIYYIHNCPYIHCEYYKGYIINTAYGQRRIMIKNGEELFYGDEEIYCEPYVKIMFTIKFKDNQVIIAPYPMAKFTPQEIDLAILEFENAIEPIYQKALKKEEKHKCCVKYFSKIKNN